LSADDTRGQGGSSVIDITVDVVQYDCPFVDATVDDPVAFSANHWEFDPSAERLETRMFVEAADRGALDDGLSTLRAHDAVRSYRLLSRAGEVAHVQTVVHQTAAMRAVRANDGYVNGPFYATDGSELWHVGFDDAGRADAALAALDRDNDYEVVSRARRELADVEGVVRNAGAAMTLIEGCRDLSDVERRTLEAAVDDGYFESPRDATLGSLADEFGVSKPAVSKTLRRGQRKTMRRVVDALRELDDATPAGGRDDDADDGPRRDDDAEGTDERA
jgi:predicted DNA binding protein